MKITFLLLLFLMPLFLFSQSREKEIPAAVQKKIAAAEKETDSKKQFGEALQLLRWGKENNNTYVKAKAYQVIAEVYRPQRGQRLFEADSLSEYYASDCNNKMLHFEALRLEISDLLNDNNLNKAKFLIDKTDTLFDINITLYQKCVVLQLKAFYYLKKFDPKTAIALYKKSIACADSANDVFLKARSYTQISTCYMLRMNPDSASWYLFQALALQEKSGNFFEIAAVYDDLGLLFRVSANKEKALEYFLKAIHYYEKANAPVNSAYTNLKTGEMYIGWKQPQDALSYLQNARTAFDKINYGKGLSLTYSLLARYYAQINNKDSADFFSARAKSISGPEESLAGFYVAGQQIAKDIELGNYKKSDSLLKITLPKTDQLLPEELISKAIEKGRSGSDSSKNFYLDAFNSRNNDITSSNADAAVINPFSGFPNKKDSLIASLIQQNQQNIESVDSLKRQVIKDSLTDANRQIALREKELTIKNLSLSIFAIAFFAVAVLTFYIFRSRRTISREKEFTLHYAKGNLSIINANIADIGRTSKVPEDFKLLQRKIFPLSSLYKRLEEKLTDKIYMADYLGDICKNLSIAYSLDRSISLNIDAPVYLQGKKAQIVGFIVSEVVTNSFKHAFTEMQRGEINVICKNQQKGFELKVTDNGKGFDEATIKKGQGTDLIKGLAQELSAAIKKGNTEGTQFEFYFV